MSANAWRIILVSAATQITRTPFSNAFTRSAILLTSALLFIMLSLNVSERETKSSSPFHLFPIAMLSAAEKRNMLLEIDWLDPDLPQVIRQKVLHILCRVPISRQTVLAAHTPRVPHRRFSLSSLSIRPHLQQSHPLRQLSQPTTQCQCRPLLLYRNSTQARPRPRHRRSLLPSCSQ